MEVHTPERPLHTVKDVFLQITIVTIGILIALSLEAIVEWGHNWALVREAPAMLTQVIRANNRQVDAALQKAPAIVDAHKQVLEWINERLAHKNPTIHDLHLGYVQVLLSDSSWYAAEATGVLAHMGYDEVHKYADVYALQAEAMRLQQRTIDIVVAEARQVEFEDLERLTDTEPANWKQQVIALLSHIRAEESFAKAVSNRFRTALAEP